MKGASVLLSLHQFQFWIKNFDCCFGCELSPHTQTQTHTLFHGLLCLLLLLYPRGIQVSLSTPRTLLNQHRNHLHHVYWFLVTAALTCKRGIRLSVRLQTFFCVAVFIVRHKSSPSIGRVLLSYTLRCNYLSILEGEGKLACATPRPPFTCRNNLVFHL